MKADTRTPWFPRGFVLHGTPEDHICSTTLTAQRRWQPSVETGYSLSLATSCLAFFLKKKNRFLPLTNGRHGQDKLEAGQQTVRLCRVRRGTGKKATCATFGPSRASIQPSLARYTRPRLAYIIVALKNRPDMLLLDPHERNGLVLLDVIAKPCR